MQTDIQNDLPVAIVTGAARGIGLATARRLLEDGFHVVMTDKLAEKVCKEAEILSAEGYSVEGLALDITERTAVAALMERLPRIDAVVNNAAIFWDGEFDEVTESDFTDMFEVNVVGSFVVAQEAAKRLKRGGKIVNIASRAFLAGRAHSPYIASKAGVVGLTRAMAAELAPDGILVNCIAPGLIETEMFRSLPVERQEELIDLLPTKSVGQPEDIANAVSFFAAPRTQNVTGQVMLCDGGRSVGISTY